MKKGLLFHSFSCALIFWVMFFGSINIIQAQEVSIINYNVDANGQVQLEVNSSTDYYYILKVRHHIDSTFNICSSMTLGESGTTIISESLGRYPLAHYQVLEYPISLPFDSDADGVDDLTEYNNIPLQSPINAADPITKVNGLVALDTLITFSELAELKDDLQWSPYLNGKEFLKFIILDFNSPNPKTYFINTKRHPLHINFATFLGVDHLGPNVSKGHIIYHPTVISNNGTLGTFAFNYTNSESMPFETVQRTQELLASNMTFLKNNLSYYVNENNEVDYYSELNLFQNSRVPVLFESDVYAGVDYWGLNQTESYGFFRHVLLNEVPGPQDIVLYEAIPNSLPRVGGIITSVIQTPLSHVNLRALQDDIPNAFIRDPLKNDTIASLLGDYVYFKADQSDFTIRKATLDEVNGWYVNRRPETKQDPPLNLDYTTILSLDQITFDMFDGFGAKCTNVATMRRLGFPEGTIPNGYGVPFYFYQEFMKHNDFFEEIDIIISSPDFISDRTIRDEMLNAFRKKIRDADIPQWMLTELADMQNSFPVGTSIRCRSSTNNEDLPGFSGAGLYTSKTQHPEEGHISKSLKQVYASIWNLRAYEEREFYKVNHFLTSMGMLCHPNYEDEKVNGVGVSADPIYNTSNTFYLNSQVDSELITNPTVNARPEEILLNPSSITEDDNFTVINYSSLAEDDSLLMSKQNLKLLTDYLSVIHHHFGELYKAENNTTFAMDIEYKITSEDQLIIKQARPWISYVEATTSTAALDVSSLTLFPNPAEEFINVDCDECNLNTIRITDIRGKLILQKTINTNSNNTYVAIHNLSSGTYIISGYKDQELYNSRLFIKR